MRDVADDVFGDLVDGSLLQVVAIREHLRPEVVLLAERIEEILREAIPRMFRKVPPENEPDLNAKVAALLATHLDDLTSEHPLARFACASVVPDHETQKAELLIEAKYIRNGMTPSKATEGISADLSKFPEDAFILFLVLDQHHAIPDDREFVRDIERRRECRVVLIR